MYKHSKKEDLIQVAQELGAIVPEGATIIKLKELIEKNDLFKSEPDFIKDLIYSTVEERKAKLIEENKIELEKIKLLQSKTIEENKLEIEKTKLAQIEKQLELAAIRNTSETNQTELRNTNTTFETSPPNIENLIRSIKTLSMPVPTKPENFNLFFQSLERAYTTKNVPQEFKSEILINILGERANRILLYIPENELQDYEKVKNIILREFQPTATDCLLNFRRAQRLPNESHVQFSSRLTTAFEYYCRLRNVKDFESVCELMISDKLFSSLDRDTQSHISIRQGENWFKPAELSKECDIYFASKHKSLSEINPRPFENKNKNGYRNNNQTQSENFRRPNNNFRGHHNQRFNSRGGNNNFQRQFNSNENPVCKVETQKQTIPERFLNKLQYENILVHDTEVSALIDSGSVIVCVKSSCVPENTKYDGNIILEGAFMEQEAKLAKIKLSLPKHPQNSIIVTAAVCENISKDLIIPPQIYQNLYSCQGQSTNPLPITGTKLFQNIEEKKKKNPNQTFYEDKLPHMPKKSDYVTTENKITNAKNLHSTSSEEGNYSDSKNRHPPMYATNIPSLQGNTLFQSQAVDLCDPTLSSCEIPAEDEMPAPMDCFYKKSVSSMTNTENKKTTESEYDPFEIKSAHKEKMNDELEKISDFYIFTIGDAIYSEIDLSHITNISYRKEVEDIINSYKPNKIKDTNLQMKIILSDDLTISHRPRRMADSEKIEVEKQINQWLQDGIISEETSDYSAPLVLVKKPDGSTRICVDYRQLNKKTIKERFPLPLIEDIFNKLQGAMFFSNVDMKNAYFHIKVHADSRKYTSFVTHNNQYVFNSVPFGTCNGPSVFQKFIQIVFRELLNEGTIVIFMDDILIHSITEAEGISKLKRVFEVASSYGLQLNFKKCNFLKRKINFLGHILEKGTIRPSTAKTSAVINFPEPKTQKHIQSFLGLSGYFRKFIKDYALIARPLSDLLRDKVPFHFGQDQKQAFLTLKQALSSEPVLHLYKQGFPLQVHCDASSKGFGAILFQSDSDNNMHPIHFMSRKTSPQEEKYSSYELEVLAIVEALKKFRHYLIGIKFQIYTDCQAFQQTMSKRDLPPKIARYALFLEEFNYEILHRPGTQMRHVDALSRYPVMVLQHNAMTQKIREAQAKDEFTSSIKQLLEQSATTDYVLKNNVLYKLVDDQELLIIPFDMQNQIVQLEHSKGHFGINKTETLVKQQFYFPNIRKVVENVISNCVQCILSSRKSGKQEGFLHPIPKGDAPLDTFHIDFLGPLTSTNKNYKHIFTVVDAFTKFIWIYPVKSTSTNDALEKLKHQQTTFGNPRRIISDKASAFTSKEFQKYCQDENVEHITITTGVSRGNGQAEKFYATLIPVLTKLSIEDPTKWYKHVSSVQRIINSTISLSTKYTPFELLTGIKMKNKDDLHIKETLEQEHIQTLIQNKSQIREYAKSNILKLQENSKQHYNKHRKEAKIYNVGDNVAIKRTQFGAGLKLRPRFFGPYEVTKVRPNDRYDVKKTGIHDGPNFTSTAVDFMKSWEGT